MAMTVDVSNAPVLGGIPPPKQGGSCFAADVIFPGTGLLQLGCFITKFLVVKGWDVSTILINVVHDLVKISALMVDIEVGHSTNF
jgi:hypothetical protein